MDPYEYSRTRLYMYSGDPITVQFLCDEQALDYMIDIFGKDITIQKQEDDKYLLFTKIGKIGAKLLAQQYMEHIRIVAPNDLRDEFVDLLRSTLESY